MDRPSEIALEAPEALRSLMRGGSKSFFAASLLLPPRVRTQATALYAFCRLADDAVDLGSDAAAALEALQLRLDAIYAGRPRALEADRALALVVADAGLPRKLLDALLQGFAWDAEGRRYDTLSEVMAYAARVAGAVGAMMALVMGVRDRRSLARACELGVAMQLTNIARDVGEDARNGRLYLPRRWLREAGIDPDAWLARPVFHPALAGVVARLLRAADTLYCRADAGIGALPRDCRPAIRAARLVYAEIGRQLAREGLDSVNRRAVVSARRKWMLMARASGAAWRPQAARVPAPPVLPAVRFLVDAAMASLVPVILEDVAAHPHPHARPHAQADANGRPRMSAAPADPLVPLRSLDQRIVWLIDLFERQRLQQRRVAG